MRGSLESLGSGFNSHVFGTAAGWIVRVARTSEAANRQTREMLILPIIRGSLTAAVPEPRVALAPGPVAPHGATAYRRLPGRVMSEADATAPGWERIADDLGLALGSLHSLPRADMAPFRLPRIGIDHLVRLRRQTSYALSKRLSPEEWTRVNAWWETLRCGDFASSTIVTPTHRDPWWENLTVNDTGLTGILDWEFVSLSDPANDLGVTLEMGEAFFDRVVRTYETRSARPDPTLAARARDRFATLHFYGLRTAIERGDEIEFADSMRKLRAGPVLRLL